MVVRIASLFQSMMVLRFVIAKLALLFFLAHPGSAATFANTQDFLLSRYPNRDVVPSTLISTTSAATERKSTAAGSWFKPRSSTRYGFVSVPMGAPLNGLQEAVSAASQELRRPRIMEVGSSSARLSGCPSPSRRKSSVLNVVVGSFISSLEEVKEAQRESGAMFYQQQQQEMKMPMTGYYAAPTGAGGVALQTAGGMGVMAVSSVDGSVQMVSINQNNAGKEGGSALLGAVDGLWRIGSSTLVGAYDNVMSFVESKMINNNQQHKTNLSTAFKFPQLNVASMRHDLVGFMDVDPFERSRRFHKRSKF